MPPKSYSRLNKKPRSIKRASNKKNTFKFNYEKHWQKLAKEEPNNQEMQLLGILVWLDMPYKYVGNAGLILKGFAKRGYTERCPDFVSLDGTKIIELFGEPFHVQAEEAERTIFFKTRGYDTLIIWSKELNRKNRANLYAKLLRFDRK